MTNYNDLLERIAKEELGIDTLQSRKLDSLDFKEVAVWKVRSALERAFMEGAAAYAAQHTVEEVKVVEPEPEIVIKSILPPGTERKPRAKRAPKIIELRGLKYKDRVRGGVTYPGTVVENYNADVIVGESIRIFGTMQGREYDRIFKVGDIVVTGSYNLIYTGIIIQITDTNVTVKENNRSSNMRMDLVTFTNRNHDFDLEKVRENNANWSD